MSLPGWIVIIGLVAAAVFLAVSWVVIRKGEKHGSDD